MTEDEKVAESIHSTYQIFKDLKKEGYDIDGYCYWKTNPYFRNYAEMEKWIIEN